MNNVNHTLSITDRNNINITGVNKVENFDKEEFILDTVMGYMNIKGENLEMVKLDTIDGKVVIKGKVNSITYHENIKIHYQLQKRYLLVFLLFLLNNI